MMWPFKPSGPDRWTEVPEGDKRYACPECGKWTVLLCREIDECDAMGGYSRTEKDYWCPCGYSDPDWLIEQRWARTRHEEQGRKVWQAINA